MRSKLTQNIIAKVKASYAAIAQEFDQSRQRSWKEFDDFLAYTKKGAKVLDLGCGNGRLYNSLKEKEIDYMGIDHNSHLLEAARANFPDLNFELGDMSDVTLPKNHFDNIFCIAAFHHLPGRNTRIDLVENMHQALKPNALLILTVWNLFQWKYLPLFLVSIAKCLLHFGLKTAWNDVWVKWGNYPIKRYYHAFLPKEFIKYFPLNQWKIEEFYFTRKGNRVSFWRSFNMVLIVRKI